MPGLPAPAAVTVAAAAIGNAIFDATGVRLRHVPFTTARVKAVLDARRDERLAVVVRL